MRCPPRCVNTDPDVLDNDGLADHVGRSAVLRSWLDAEQVRATRAQRRPAEQGRVTDPASSLARDGRQSSEDAKAEHWTGNPHDRRPIAA